MMQIRPLGIKPGGVCRAAGYLLLEPDRDDAVLGAIRSRLSGRRPGSARS